jgi:hypothetical protein
MESANVVRPSKDLAMGRSITLLKWPLAAAIVLAAGAATADTSCVPALVVAPAFEWGYRHYRHTEFSAPVERRYDANGYAALAIAVEAYPAALRDAPFWRDVGVTVDVARSIGLVSASARIGEAFDPPALVPVDTTFVRYDLGVRYRLVLGARDAAAPVLGAAIGYGARRFTFDESVLRPQPDLEIPQARYDLLRIGADARIPVGPVAAVGSAAYLHGFSVGSLGNRVPEGAAHGLDVTIGVTAHLWRAVSVQAAASYAVFFFNLDPVEGRAADEPGRVIDSYLTLSLGPVIAL